MHAARTQICAHVKDHISICRKRVGLTAGGMDARKRCTHERKKAFSRGKQPEFPVHCIGTRKLSNIIQSNRKSNLLNGLNQNLFTNRFGCLTSVRHVFSPVVRAITLHARTRLWLRSSLSLYIRSYVNPTLSQTNNNNPYHPH